jgi:hypothetical protein
MRWRQDLLSHHPPLSSAPPPPMAEIPPTAQAGRRVNRLHSLSQWGASLKITDIKTYPVNANEEGTSRASRPRGRNWLFVKVLTDEGVTGVGEGGGVAGRRCQGNR